MATSKQEQLYNEIVEYYDFADKLISVIEHSTEEVKEEQLEIVEGIVENLEKYADQLTGQFIEFVKNGSSDDVVSSIRKSLNGAKPNNEFRSFYISNTFSGPVEQEIGSCCRSQVL